MEDTEQKRGTILDTLPPEIFRSHIACFLSLSDLVNLAATCRYVAFGRLLQGHVLAHARLILTKVVRRWCRRIGVIPGANVKICTRSIHADDITGLAITELSRKLVAVSWDKHLSVWASCSSCLYRHLGSCLNAHDAPIQTICPLPASDKVATAGRDGVIGIWKLADVKKVVVIERERTLKGHDDLCDIRSLCVDVNGYLISGSTDKTLRLWDCENGECIRVMRSVRGHGCMYICSLVPSGNIVVAGRRGRDHSLLVYNTTNGASISDNTPLQATYCICSLGRNDEFAVGGEGNISIWSMHDHNNCSCRRTFAGRHVRQNREGERGMVTALIRCSRFRISGGSNGSVHTWDMDNGYTLLSAVNFQTSYINAMVLLLPDEKRVATAGGNLFVEDSGIYVDDAYS